ncbi:MAG: HesA/MoeB/ThiF family protein [Saprospiraceae bacterium]|nr:HesA/MoeB/ThiF family protein [Saprospiraceae bacterium]
MNNNINYNKFLRQITLSGFGVEKQLLLNNAKVLIIGAGGLGCPALLYLAAAGVGTLGLVDFDLVEMSNLHRQILYGVSDVGKSKVAVAAKKVNLLHPEVNINCYDERITIDNIASIIKDYDIILDGTDDVDTKYLINDTCFNMNIPLVFGSIYQYEGQVAIFNGKDALSNYRKLFPTPPASDSIFTCNVMGVLGVLPGIIGTIQASETIKTLTGIGDTLLNKLLIINILKNTFYEIDL